MQAMPQRSILFLDSNGIRSWGVLIFLLGFFVPAISLQGTLKSPAFMRAGYKWSDGKGHPRNKATPLTKKGSLVYRHKLQRGETAEEDCAATEEGHQAVTP